MYIFYQQLEDNNIPVYAIGCKGKSNEEELENVREKQAKTIAFSNQVVEIGTKIKENDIAIGNVVGSNICNMLLILGVSGIVGTLSAKRKIITNFKKSFLFIYITSTYLF